MLLDHFHSPLRDFRHWHSMHHAWATFLADDLNNRLPAGWFAEPNVQFGIEIDMAAFEASPSARRGEIGAVASSSSMAATPMEAPSMTIDFPIISDRVQVEVFSETAGLVLVGAIELVSPSNKDRPENREAFVAKCDGLLRQLVGVLIVDIVTTRQANLHAELLHHIDHDLPEVMTSPLYAAAYHATHRTGRTVLDVWQRDLELGKSLPVMPLHLKNGPQIDVDLEATYRRACRAIRIEAN
jgi:hypothetical protein